MAATNSPHLDEHLARTLGTTGFTASPSTVSFTSANLNEAALRALLDVAAQTGYKPRLNGGLLQLIPR